MPRWLGAEVAVSDLNDKGQVMPIAVRNSSGESTDSPVRAVLLNACANGSVRLVGAMPDDPTKEVRQQDMKNASLLVMDRTWKKQVEFLPMARVGSRPRISPAGKYVACQVRLEMRLPRGTRGAGYTVGLFSTDGKQSWSIKEFVLPVAVTDGGDVLALRAFFNPGSELILCRKGQDKPVELGKDITDAVLVGDTIYFVHCRQEDASKATLKSMPLPKN